MDAPDSYAAWLRAYRREKKLTQQELADAAGLGRTYIIALEKGRIRMPQFANRQKIHEVFGTDDAQLEDFGLIAFDQYGNEIIPPEPEPEPNTEQERPAPQSAQRVYIKGLTSDPSDGVALVGAAVLYLFRGMKRDQRLSLLEALERVDRELDEGGEDVPF